MPTTSSCKCRTWVATCGGHKGVDGVCWCGVSLRRKPDEGDGSACPKANRHHTLAHLDVQEIIANAQPPLL